MCGPAEPLAISRYYPARRLPVIDPACAEIDGLRAVFTFPFVSDLGFVATPELPFERAEKHAAVEMCAIGNYVELQYKIGMLTLGLQVAVAVLHIEPTFRCNGVNGF